MKRFRAARRIALPPWLRRPGLRRVVAAIAEEGGHARLVGGAVRGAIRKEAAGDIDLATDLAPHHVMLALRRARIRALPTGLKHGTVTALAGEPVEVTTLRVDVETFGRHARVLFTDDWHADATRRDLTINALYADLDGTVYDPVGGLADLTAGRVRFVGEPARRIEEDALRILRFFRFHARYGRGAPDAASYAACAAGAALIDGLSGERIAAEMLKLLSGRDPVPVLHAMAQAGVLARVGIDDPPLDRLERLVAVEAARGLVDPLRRLAALLRSSAASLRVADRWRLSNRDRRRLVGVAAAPPDLGDPRSIRRALHRHGASRVVDFGLLALANRITLDPDSFLRLAQSWTPLVLPVGGDDAMSLGVPSGPRIGALLRDVEAWWIASDFSAGREACLVELRRLIDRPVG
jgi:poly(A) polymerase